VRKWIAFVLVSLAVVFALGGVGFVVHASTFSSATPQRPGNLECDNNYSMASDPVCVAWFKNDSGPAHVFADLGVAAVLGVVALSLFNGWDRVRRGGGAANSLRSKMGKSRISPREARRPTNHPGPFLPATANERLRPSVQLADPVPGIEVLGARACFDVSVLPGLDAESLSHLTDREAATFAILSEEVRGRCHGATD
jgi:hypothetical protein